MNFSVHQLSRQGGRANNEDRMAHAYTEAAALLVVADGMGGHPQGDVAAELAVRTMVQQFEREAQPRVMDPADFLQNALWTAHQAIVDYGVQQQMPDAPRTTVVAALLQDQAISWVHCGDSRLYWVRDGQLLTRTRDHSYDEQPPAGWSPSAWVNRHVLYTCLGASMAPIHAVQTPLLLQSADRVLLCSDGLWDGLSDTTIAALLQLQPLKTALSQLVSRALQAGGERCDNVTAVGLEWLAENGFANTVPASGCTSNFQEC